LVGAGADPKKPNFPGKAKQESEAQLMKGMVDVSRMDMTPAGMRSGLGIHIQVRQLLPFECPLMSVHLCLALPDRYAEYSHSAGLSWPQHVTDAKELCDPAHVVLCMITGIIIDAHSKV
jgi:hypothetical protein